MSILTAQPSLCSSVRLNLYGCSAFPSAPPVHASRKSESGGVVMPISMRGGGGGVGRKGRWCAEQWRRDVASCSIQRKPRGTVIKKKKKKRGGEEQQVWQSRDAHLKCGMLERSVFKEGETSACQAYFLVRVSQLITSMFKSYCSVISQLSIFTVKYPFVMQPRDLSAQKSGSGYELLAQSHNLCTPQQKKSIQSDLRIAIQMRPSCEHELLTSLY